MRLRTWLVPLLAILLAGCSRAPEPWAPSHGTVQVGNRYLSFVPPEGWKPQGKEWFKSGEGRLSVIVHGPEGRAVAADRVSHALGLLAENPEAAAQALAQFPPPPVWFEHEPDRERLNALCQQVRDARDRIRKDPARARDELEEARDGFRQAQIGDDPEARARNYLENLNLRGGQRTLESVAPATAGGRPAAIAIARDPHRSHWTMLFLVYDGQLVVFQVNSSPEKAAAAAEHVRTLAGGLEFDVSAPPDVVAETPAPAPEKAAGFDWQGWIEPLIPPLVFLLFTSFPAWVGAGFGYDTAALTGGNVRRGAAGAAFQATGCGITLACLLVSGFLLFLVAGAKGGGGIMSPGMAWVLMTLMILVLGLFVGGAGGALAATGAWLGAGTSRRTAQWMAAVLAAGGAVLGPFLLKGFLSTPVRRKRGALPPPPVAAVASVSVPDAVLPALHGFATQGAPDHLEHAEAGAIAQVDQRGPILGADDLQLFTGLVVGIRFLDHRLTAPSGWDPHGQSAPRESAAI